MRCCRLLSMNTRLLLDQSFDGLCFNESLAFLTVAVKSLRKAKLDLKVPNSKNLKAVYECTIVNNVQHVHTVGFLIIS